MLTYYSCLHYYSVWRQLIVRRLLHPLRRQLARLRPRQLMSQRLAARRRRQPLPPTHNPSQLPPWELRLIQVRQRRLELARLTGRDTQPRRLRYP